MNTGLESRIVVRNPAGVGTRELESMRLAAEVVIGELSESLDCVARLDAEWVMESERTSDGAAVLVVAANSIHLFAVGYDAKLGRLYLGDACMSSGEASIVDIMAAALDLLGP